MAGTSSSPAAQPSSLMDRAEFVKSMAVLAAGVGRPFTKEQHAVWYECLNHLTPDQMNRAVKTWLCSIGSGFPKIKEILDLAAQAEHGQQADWQEVWGLVMQALRVWSPVDVDAAMRAKSMLAPEVYGLMYAVTGGFYNMSLADAGQIAVWSSNFRDAWGRRNTRQATVRALPESLRPAVERIGYTPEELTRLTSALPEGEFEQYRKSEIQKLAVYAVSEPVVKPKERPPSRSREEQLALLEQRSPE